MISNFLNLTPKEILDKEFKIDTRGYRPQEVDKFLDTVMEDYHLFNKKIRQMTLEIDSLIEEIDTLKKENKVLMMKLDNLSENTSSKEINNSDLLRRLSNLEKMMYNRNE